MKKHPIPITLNNPTFMQQGGVAKNNKNHVTVYKSIQMTYQPVLVEMIITQLHMSINLVKLLTEKGITQLLPE